MRLGEMLIERKLITAEDLERALELQKERGDKLGKTLVDMGFIAMRDVLAALSDQLGVPLVAIDGPPVVSSETESLSPRFLRQFRCLPLSRDDHTVTLAMADPLDVETIATVRGCTGLSVNAVLAAEQEILDAIDKYYGESAAGRGDFEFDLAGGEMSEDLEHLRDMASEAPVIRQVNAIIAQAVEKRASDIHLEPFEKEFRIRYRVDGVLYNQDAPPREMKAAMISRVKLMAKLNIAERRLPQDGRIKIKTLGREVDLRVSTLPTLYGESVVMRLLDRSAGDFYDLGRLGFDQHMLNRMEHYTSLPHGIFLVTGPTGSGKSTTLYSALKRINQSDKKIITIEDPVEYQMDGINQIHVNPQIGLTFASGLRHIVRQDPDVIMVGEIRDRETADIAIRASLTGHFVFSTLHTNDAPSAISRLTDMGVENYLITSSLVAVLAQRLVRVICPNCKEPDGERIGPDGETVPCFRGRGCEECFGSGYTGRVGIFEMMELNDDIRKLIMRAADAAEITNAARRNGMRNLREDGWLKVGLGVTTPDEVMRVTQEF
ncbi:MAG TPA: type II secretion system ATPase GspE [Bryobacteraceae bacterium]|nr:type II secretion system ATPase GspE [Bryobacteraceae bacterium]HUO32255.1 type II secretion system ATPase GspE [Bryobacteraceae bacterium]